MAKNDQILLVNIAREHLGRGRRTMNRLKDNIDMDLKQTRYEGYTGFSWTAQGPKIGSYKHPEEYPS
jgi:hypothetical protein